MPLPSPEVATPACRGPCEEPASCMCVCERVCGNGDRQDQRQRQRGAGRGGGTPRQAGTCGVDGRQTCCTGDAGSGRWPGTSPGSSCNAAPAPSVPTRTAADMTARRVHRSAGTAELTQLKSRDGYGGYGAGSDARNAISKPKPCTYFQPSTSK